MLENAPPSSWPAKAGHPVTPAIAGSTGCPACAGHDANQQCPASRGNDGETSGQKLMSVETASAAQTSPFWTFSLGYYRGAGVSEACLELQDNCGVDVNVMLFLLWQASLKRHFGAVQVKALAEKVGPWQIDVIGPIRGLRRMLKGNAPLLDK